jgi:hypothetical protein
VQKGDCEEILPMPGESEKYWEYSRECTEQALEAEVPELRNQLLDLARMWTQAARSVELNAKRSAAKSSLPSRSSSRREIVL